LNASVAWTTSGETNSCPAGPKIKWMAFVSLFWAAATKALSASFGELKVCSSAAETQIGRAKASPNAASRAWRHEVSEFIFIGNLFLKIIGIEN
jgi:hypothetical protein